jgi:hypothetical protein
MLGGGGKRGKDKTPAANQQVITAYFKPGDGDADDAQSISQQVERDLKRG